MPQWLVLGWMQIATRVEADTETEARLRAQRRTRVILDGTLTEDAWLGVAKIVDQSIEHVVELGRKPQPRNRRKGDKHG